MINGEHSRLTFRVKCETERGQVVAISGDTSGLGFFRKSLAVQLVTTPEEYPYWKTSTPIVVPSHHIVNYKFCIVEGGTFHSYESIEANRSITPEELDIFIEAEYTKKLNDDNYNVHSDVDLALSDNVPRAKELSNPASLDSNDAYTGAGHRLLFTCYHLPVIVRRVETPDLFEITWSESVLAKTENSVSSAVETYWIGTLTLDDTVTSDDKIVLVRILKSMNCIPIFIEKSVANGHYHGYCKQVLWPLFHNVDQIDSLHAVWKSTIPKSRGVGSRVRADSNSNATSPIASPGGSMTASGLNQVPNLNAPVPEELIWILDYYDKYLQVNKFFADVITGMLEPGDIVWVHDYHLLLLPKLLRDSHDYKRCCALSTNPNLSSGEPVNETATPDLVRIIFFLHIPFPTSQIFRTLPRGTELLHSLMCADVIGFHSFDYTRHFLNAAKRILGNRSRARPGGLLSLIVDDREIIVTMNHLAIEPLLLQQALLNPTTRVIAEAYATKYANKKLVVGVDPCQRLSGLIYKFDAFDRFLSENVSRGASKNVVLIQRCIRNGSRRDDEACTSAELIQMVNSINARYNKKNSVGGLSMPSANARANSAAIVLSSGSAAPTPVTSNQSQGRNVIDYEEVPALNLLQRVALWLVSDVFLLTSLREGLNSCPMEYIYTRKSLAHAGAVIASEFSLSSSLLSGSVKVNPFNVQQVVDSLEKCIYMTDKEANYRRMRDLDFISSRHSSTWVRRIFQDMAQLNRNTDSDACYLLDPADVVESYKKSITNTCTNATDNVAVGTRVFIIDYGGTLAAKQKVDIYVKETYSVLSESVPSASVLESIRTLSNDPNNIVMICSGISMERLTGVFSDLPNVTLVASHGMSYSWGANIIETMSPMDRDNEISSSFISKAVEINGRDWFVRQFNVDWAVIADIAVPIITKFKERTNGTTADLNPPMLRFNYFGADPDWGAKQASQLVIELEASLAKHDVKVISSSDGSVEILPFGVDKSILPKLLLNRLLLIRKICIGNTSQLPRFIVCMGDDKSNDKMFSSIYDTVAHIVIPSQKANASPIPRSHIYTIGVGRMSCDAAEYYVRGIEDVEDLLSELSVASSNKQHDGRNSADSTASQDVDIVEQY